MPETTRQPAIAVVEPVSCHLSSGGRWKVSVRYTIYKPRFCYLTIVLFNLMKGYARLAIKIFCRTVVINQPEWLSAKGPLLIASNHPNSFLDGIIMTILFGENIYSLARGDAFKNPKHNRLLRWLHLLPVYRTSEGVNNLEHNYTTFDTCREIFEAGGIVMIFSEGRCINEWHLRPLRKGTARLAINSWQAGIDVTVLPVGLNYSPFRNFGKAIVINFGNPLIKKEVLRQPTDGKMFLAFNTQLKASLKNLVYEIDPDDKEALKEKFFIGSSFWKKTALALPAVTGFILHAPLYFTAKSVTKKYFHNDHFDSVLVGLLLIAYPIYVLAFVVWTGIFFGWMFAPLALIMLPFSARACVQLKTQ